MSPTIRSSTTASESRRRPPRPAARLAQSDNQIEPVDRRRPTSYGYCVFGEVTGGMEVVDRIAKLPVHDVSNELTDVPVEQVVVKWIHIAR